MDVVIDFGYKLLIWLDSIIYGFIGTLYTLFISIAQTRLFQTAIFSDFSNRIYTFLSIFMIFRLSFSILTYIISPDKASDNATGGKKLLANVLLTLVLILSVPRIFDIALDFQAEVLKENIIGQMILGMSESSEPMDDSLIADRMAFTSFSAFFYPVDPHCESIDHWNVPGFDPKEDPCYVALNKYTVKINKQDRGVGDLYYRAYKARSVESIQQAGLVSVTYSNSTERLFKYTPFISTLCGGAIIFILLKYCISIAARTVKFAVLRLIAPIPIISYIDPKQGKDGIFKKWASLCMKTYLDLFVRLASIYFAIYVISLIASSGANLENVVTGGQINGVTKVFLMVGTLMVVGDLPKLYEQLTGNKLGGEFNLKDNKFAKGVLAAGAGGALGAVGGAVGNMISGNGVRAAIGGSFRGLASGAIGGAKGQKFDQATLMRGSRAAVQHGNLRSEWKASGSTLTGRIGAQVRSAVGSTQLADKYEEELKSYEAMGGYASKAKELANKELQKNTGFVASADYSFVKADGTSERMTFDPSARNQDDFNLARQEEILNIMRRDPHADVNETIEQQNKVEALRKVSQEKMFNELYRSGDAEARSIMADADRERKKGYDAYDKKAPIDSYGQLDKTKKRSETQTSNIKNDDKYKTASANKKAANQAKSEKK